VKSKEKKPGPHAACGGAERAGPSCAGRVVGRATRRCGSAPTGAGSWRWRSRGWPAVVALGLPHGEGGSF